MSQQQRRFPWARALAYAALLVTVTATVGMLVRDVLDWDWVGALVWGAVLLLGGYLASHLVRMELRLHCGLGDAASGPADSTSPGQPSSAIHGSLTHELTVTVGDGETRIDVPLRNVALVDRVKALLHERELLYRTVSNPLPELTSPLPERHTVFVVPVVDPNLVRELEELASSET